jgi:hypothetical protein
MNNIESVIIDDIHLKIDRILYSRNTFTITASDKEVLKYFQNWFNNMSLTINNKTSFKWFDYKRDILFGKGFIIYNAFISSITTDFNELCVELCFDRMNENLAKELLPFMKERMEIEKEMMKIEMVEPAYPDEVKSYLPFFIYFVSGAVVALIIRTMI